MCINEDLKSFKRFEEWKVIIKLWAVQIYISSLPYLSYMPMYFQISPSTVPLLISPSTSHQENLQRMKQTHQQNVTNIYKHTHTLHKP